MSPQDTKKLIDTVKALDGLISETANFKSLFNMLGNLLFSSNRKASREIEYQQLVERLASNDLFLKSAELQALS